jgi:ferrous iron transport protein B
VSGLVVDGVIGGVGSVLSFVPQILMLFLFLTLLEDIGYMARAAFIMDRVFRRFGLSGKSFIPLLMGFGCTVPAVMATRTIENEQDRKLTVFITPFVACGAKAPIFAVFTAAFVPRTADVVVMLFYLAGVLLAFLTAFVFKKTLFKGANSPFIMELPPYRLPDGMTVLRTLWEKLRGYLVRAGTLIFGMSVVVWFLMNFGWNLHPVDAIDQSILAGFGRAIAPIFTPLGFGDWRTAVSLLTGFIAKEAVVGTMGVVYNTANLAAVLPQHFTAAASLAFLTFSLLYVPCVAAVSALRKEFGSWRWTLIQIAYGTTFGWVLGWAAFQIGVAFGLGMMGGGV